MESQLREIGEVQIRSQKKKLMAGTVNDNYQQEVDGIPFDGHRVLWSFSYKPETYLKESELSGDEWRKGGTVTIYRDGVSVFSEFCRTTEQAIRIIHWKMPLLQEFWWDYVKVGHKLYNHNIPATITRVLADGNIIVKSDNGEPFPWAFKQEEMKEDPENYEDEWGAEDKMHVLSEHLYWFRK